jgi:sn-glycerol 3-phosphate transport system permease protein
MGLSQAQAAERPLVAGQVSRPEERPRYVTHLLLIAACLFVALPMIFAVIKSTQDRSQVLTYPPSFVPGTSMLSNYSDALIKYNVATFMLNSTFVALAVTVGKTILALLAATAFVYFRFPLKSALFALVLATLLMPTEILIIGLFNFVTDVLGWGNNYLGLIVPFLASATGIFLFRQHFANIPTELADAAQIDGAGPLRFLWSILIPNSWNVIGALALIQFIYMWNQYIWPLIIINDDKHQMIQVGLRNVLSTDASTNWGVALASAVIASLPPLLFFLLLQDSFVRSFALSRDK